MTINSNNFRVDKYGNMTCSNANITGGNINMTGNSSTPTIKVHDSSGNQLEMYPSNFWMTYDYWGETVSQYLQKGGYYVENESTGQSTTVWYDGIETPRLTQTSLESEKKNFEKFQNALEILKDIDIYKYNLKNEENETKKHIGFVIGDSFKYSEEVTSKNNDGVDLYSFVSLCCKAIQEQQDKIDKLEQEIKTLKEER